MDQNANGVGGQVVDYFANPTPLTPTANPFTGPYDTATLPIVIGGPQVVSTFVPNGTSDPTGSAQPGNNLVLNSTVGSIDVTFNSPMNPASFTPGQVLTMTGPTGPIVGPFAVFPDPQTGENPNFPNTFKITFPTQQLSGTYTLTLGAGILSQAGRPRRHQPERGRRPPLHQRDRHDPVGPDHLRVGPGRGDHPGHRGDPVDGEHVDHHPGQRHLR